MCNQYVLRGGSCLTSRTHIRPTYRNFFYPSSCWQCTGIRLVKEKRKCRTGSLLNTKTHFLQDVVKGLTQTPKTLSPKYFYNKRGSELFDKICKQPEYYVTRTEIELLKKAIEDLKELIPSSSAVIEFGSGNCEKIGCLLKQATHIQTAILIDISKEFIQLTARKLKNTFPHLSVHPLAVDFLKLTSLPEHRDLRGKYPLIFFPGSTIGNFDPEICQELLSNIAHLVKPAGGLLIGIDLVKDTAVLEAAYNDKAGVTAAFNLNMLQRINQELGGNFPIGLFKHRAFFNTQKQRIEMHLECQKECLVSIGDQNFLFKQGETIHTENSHKFELSDFTKKGERAGFSLRKHWVDSNGYFGLLYFTLQ
jgi:dimethylhistidine N-methyltransferase